MWTPKENFCLFLQNLGVSNTCFYFKFKFFFLMFTKEIKVGSLIIIFFFFESLQ